jgi:hypothetical protein
VDEHAELRVAEPLHALVTLFLGLIYLRHLRHIRRTRPAHCQQRRHHYHYFCFHVFVISIELIREARAKPPSSVLQAQYSEASIQYSEL